MPRDYNSNGGGWLWAWVWEIAAVVGSNLFLLSLAMILLYFNGREISDKGPFTLNAGVSVVSTFISSMLLFAVASAISQWNWILFATSPRRLFDFQRVTDAARGLLGSVTLLVNCNIRGGSKGVRFGALITILIIALPPFAQQLVQLSQKMRFDDSGGKSGTATIPCASRYSQGNRNTVFSGATVGPDGRLQATSPQVVFADADFALQSAAIFGITADRSFIQQQISLNCSSSECTFPATDSLAVCAECADITRHLSRNTLSFGDQFYDLSLENGVAVRKSNCTEYRLPNGLYLNNMDGESGGGKPMVYLTMLGATNTSKTVAMGHVDTLIWSQSIIKVDGNRESKNKWPDYGVRATECALYYCVRNYTSEVRNATLFETSSILRDQRRVPNSWMIDDAGFYEGISDVVVQSLAFHPTESSISRTDLQLGDKDKDKDGSHRWNVSQPAVNGISAFMQKVFAACLDKNTTNCTPILDNWAPVNGFLVAGTGEQYQPSIAKALWDSTDLNYTFDNIAMSMSTAIRNGADNHETRSGSLGVPITVYVVDWRWISLHCIVEAASVVFLFLTIWATVRGKDGRVPVWKDSQLAIFSWGSVVGGSLRDAETIKELEQKAKAVSVDLLDQSRGARKLGDEGPALPLVDRMADQRQINVCEHRMDVDVDGDGASGDDRQYEHPGTGQVYDWSYRAQSHNGNETGTN